MQLSSIVSRAIALSFFAAASTAPVAWAACVEAGGTEHCGSPFPAPWIYRACDEAAAFLFRVAAWCTASGGTNPNGGCPGATPHTEENIAERSVRFTEIIEGSSCSVASDTGWGASYLSNFCLSGSDTYQSGILRITHRRLTITCANGGSELISLRKDRALECPPGYTASTNPGSGALVCKRALENCDGCAIGNPITPATGVKVQSEVDYRHPLGLQFTRHYHSFQFYEPFSRAAGGVHTENRLGAVWRTGFDKRIIVLDPASAFVKTAISLPTGEVQYFDAAGNEIFNYRGASGTLVTVAGTGYFYKGPDRTELYGADGRLKSIALASGPVFTLAYSDGTSGPNGGFILDAGGNPTSIALPANSLIRVADLQGNTLSFGYDIQRRIVVMTDPGGGRYRFSYDPISNLTSVTYPDARVRIYSYNEPANMVEGASIRHALTSIIDENEDLYASFSYDASGRAVSTQHADGVQRHELAYGTSDTSVTDPLATQRTLGFATVGGIARYLGASQPGGAGYGFGVKRRTHDGNGNVASQTDFNDAVTCYAHDGVRNLETMRVEGLPLGTSCAAVLGSGAALPAGSRKVTTEWHPRWRLPVRVAEPRGRTTFVYHGDAGASCAPASAVIDEGGASPTPLGAMCSRSLQGTDDANGAQGFDATAAGTPRTWTYAYNANGSVLTVNGPRTDVSDVTTHTYYANDDPDPGKRGNLATLTNAAGHTTSITAYNAHGQPLTIVDPNGLTTTLTYDERQRLKTRTVGSELTSYDYDGVGQLTRVTLPDGSFLSYTYDAAHRLTGTEDNAGNRIAYTLDAMGNRTQEQVFDPANQLAQTRSRVYGNLNRLFQELGAQNQATEYGYDDQGNVTSVKDPLNRITTHQYDALNRLKQVTDPGLGVTQYAYNGLDALTQVTDPRNLVTGYTVDGLGNLTLQSSPDTGNTSSTYDAAGNLLTQTDAKAQVTTYTYDALNRVTLITFHDGSKQTYAYDQGANGIGRLSSITETDPGNQITSILAYAYDLHGRVTSETRTVAGVQYVLGYSYDSAGRLAGLTYPSGRTVTHAFDTLGRVSAVDTTKDSQSQAVVSNVSYHPFGGVKSFTLGNGQSYTRSYDQDGRISSYTLGSAQYAIGYDAASRIEFISQVGNPPNTNTYGYDALDRLTSAVTPGTPFAYTYDAVGNRLTRTVGSATDTLTYSTASNRIDTLAPGSGPMRSFVFDANGSTIDDGVNTYDYDVRGRMMQAAGASGTTIYQVNALGQRIRKTSAQLDRVFHYDMRGRLIAETDSTGAPRRELIYLGDVPVGVLQ